MGDGVAGVRRWSPRQRRRQFGIAEDGEVLDSVDGKFDNSGEIVGNGCTVVPAMSVGDQCHVPLGKMKIERRGWR